MKAHHVILSLAILAAFLYYTERPLPPRIGMGAAPPTSASASGEPLTAAQRERVERDLAGLGADERNSIEVYRDASAAVVNVTTQTLSYDFFSNAYPTEGSGSGFLIDDEGHIVTNFHVINNARQVKVTLGKDQTHYTAEIVGSDRHSDLAVLKIRAAKKLPYLKLGDSGALMVGQKVLAIGNPFGQFQNTLTTGVVSSVGRTIRDQENNEMEDMIQTDAAINHGNSGGPLLNSHGEVIGINSAIIGQNYLGIGFAIPISKAKAVVDELLQTGHVARPWMGVEMFTVAGDIAEALHMPADEGALVVRIVENSPAQAAGLRGPDRMAMLGFYQIPVGGDLIVGVDGKSIATREEVIRAIDHHKVGDEMVLAVYRGSHKMDVKIKLAALPQQSVRR